MPESATSGKMSLAERNTLAVKYLPLVKKVAYRIVQRVPGRIDVNDLISSGCVGLLTALDRFDPSRGKPFDAYAEWRIKGAILDELRSYDHMTRTQRQLSNKVNKAKRRLEQAAGGEVDAAIIAEETNLDLETVEQVLGRAEGPGFVSLSDVGLNQDAVEDVMRSQRAGPMAADPYQNVYLKDLKTRMVKALADLPEREQLVLSLYYIERLTYKEIGAVLDRTESRVCQIHKSAIGYLQDLLGEGPARGARRKGKAKRKTGRGRRDGKPGGG